MDQAKIDAETAEIKRLEAMPMLNMTAQEAMLHTVAIKDAYWRRMMAMRTEEEVKRNICAPG